MMESNSDADAVDSAAATLANAFIDASTQSSLAEMKTTVGCRVLLAWRSASWSSNEVVLGAGKLTGRSKLTTPGLVEAEANLKSSSASSSSLASFASSSSFPKKKSSAKRGIRMHSATKPTFPLLHGDWCWIGCAGN